MKRKTVYLLFCILGVVLPYSQFLPWVMENGLHMKFFFQQLFANRIGGFFGMDVLVSAVVLILSPAGRQETRCSAPLAADCGSIHSRRVPWSAAVSLSS